MLTRPSAKAAGVRLLAAMLCLCSAAPAARAATPTTFPYEAAVRSNEVEVRSGPGQRYYVTGRLHQNDRVTVHRHDPGGWYMIAPPAGSFSWLEAALVRRDGPTQGVVELPTAETSPVRALVRIGSEFTTDHSFYGRELAQGDAVEILGEQTLNTDQGSVNMLKISPPAFEYRWVKGDYIVASTPAPTEAPIAMLPAPALAPISRPEASRVASEPDPFAEPAATAARPLPVATSESPANGTFKERLARLDERFLALPQQPPEEWNLSQLVAEYEQLQTAADPSQALTVDQRLESLSGRLKVWNDYQAFIELTRKTAERDAELLASQSNLGAPAPTVIPAGGTASTEGGIVPASAQMESPPPTSAVASSAPPAPGNMQPTPLAPGSLDATAAPSTPPGMTPLRGAGVIRRLPAPTLGGHQYVLTDAQGNMLALLQPAAGLDLEPHVNQPRGIVGSRSFNPQMGADVLQVQKLIPVQLAR